jgi:acyl-CoA reductase-like NAD-dependent aldehyde dehydrogenase
MSNVRTIHRLFIGGAFPRAASGRTFDVHGPDGAFLARAALAAGRDARDAVVAARAAFPAWSRAAGFDRGQALYRVAEVLDDHRAQFAAQVRRATAGPQDAADAEVDAAVDRWTWYAGWADKITQVRGTVNPVAGQFATVSLPEPVGVTAVLAPQDGALLGLVSVLAPVIVSGNTAVPAARRGPRRGPGRRRAAGRRGERAHRRGRRDSALAGRPPGRERHRPGRRPRCARG